MSRIDLNKKYYLKHIDWSLGINGSSNGILPKAIINDKGSMSYLKLGSFSSPFGFYGIEPIVELINSRIGKILNLPVLDYNLINASIIMNNNSYDTLISISKSYKNKNTQGVSFENFYDIYKEKGETTIDFVKRFGFSYSIYKQFIFDFIICNLDRHGKNTEVLFLNKDKMEIAPFFDNSFTFILNRPENDLINKVKFNDMMRVNNFIGSQNLRDNLLKIDKEIKIRNPRKEDRKFIFQGLGKMTSKNYREFVWDMINRRVEHVKSEKIPYIKWY